MIIAMDRASRSVDALYKLTSIYLLTGSWEFPEAIFAGSLPYTINESMIHIGLTTTIISQSLSWFCYVISEMINSTHWRARTHTHTHTCNVSVNASALGLSSLWPFTISTEVQVLNIVVGPVVQEWSGVLRWVSGEAA